MASTGICPNTTGCTLGFRKEPIQLGKDARCPECGTALQPSTTEHAGRGDRGKLWMMLSLAGLLMVVCVLLVVLLIRKPSGSPAPAVPPTPAGENQPVAPPSNTSTQTPVSRPSSTRTPPLKPAEPDVTKRTPERDAVRTQVLKRIERMPNITEAQRDALYTQLQHARGFGRMATIGFDAGQSQLTAAEIETFKQALQNPRIRKLLNNPGVILVVLGFADAVESPDSGLASSTDRAESVANVLRNQAGILNVIHTVGMGNSQMFGMAPEQNRITEVWAVLP